MKKAAISGGRLRPLDTLSRSDLYIGIRIVHVVVIEDVLVLVYGPRVRCVYLVHLTSLGKPRPPAAVDELIQVKGVFYSRALRSSSGAVSNRIWTKRTGAGPATAKCTCRPGMVASSLGVISSPAQPLGILVVAFRLPHGSGPSVCMEMVAFPSQFSEISLMVELSRPTQEDHAVHVSQDRFRVIFVNGLALRVLLVEQAQTHLAGTDHGHQLLQRGHLAPCWPPRPTQHPHMLRAGGPREHCPPVRTED